MSNIVTTLPVAEERQRDWRDYDDKNGRRRGPVIIVIAIVAAVTVIVGVTVVAGIRRQTGPVDCERLIAEPNAAAGAELGITLDAAGDSPAYLNDVATAIERSIAAIPPKQPIAARVQLVADRTTVAAPRSPCLQHRLLIASSERSRHVKAIVEAVRTSVRGASSRPTSAPALWQQEAALLRDIPADKARAVIVGSWHLAIEGQPATCGTTPTPANIVAAPDGAAVTEADELVRLCVEAGLLEVLPAASSVLLFDTPSVNRAPEARKASSAVRAALCAHAVTSGVPCR